LYHYRAKAVGDTTVYGSDQTFTTGNNLPGVTTNAASGITTSGSTLNGNLTSKGSASSITVSFEYGLTTSYGSTADGVPATLTAPGTFTADITGLVPSTLYHYRAKAVGDGTAYGNDQTFTTGNPAPVVVTGVASNITINGATLNGNLSSKGSASTVTMSFEYGLTTSYGSTVVGIPVTLTAPGTFTASVIGLTPNTLYHYRAKAVGDTTVYGLDQAFITSNATPTAPTVPTAPVVTTYIASDITTGGATLNGNLTGKGSASSVTVSFEFGLTTSYGNTVAGIPATLTAPGTFTASVIGLTPNTLYHYRAKAVGSSTAYGSDQTFTIGTSSPEVITDAASGITTGGATLNGNLTGKGSASSVTVSFEFGLTTSYGSTVAGVPIILTDPGSFTARINNLKSNTLYHYRAKAVGHSTVYGLDQTFTTDTSQPVVAANATSDITALTPEITLLGVIISYANEISQVGVPISAKVTFWISNPTVISDIKPVLLVKLDGEPLEEVTDLYVDEPETEDTIGNCVYIPSDGWKPGVYSFYLELVGPEGILCESEEQSLNVRPIAIVINWSVLLVIIAAGIGASLIITCVLLIRKRLLYGI
jgi:phosphodiesterase/alkaline phosphatase D-like protein